MNLVSVAVLDQPIICSPIVAFLCTFTAMIVAGLIWMSLFVAFIESRVELLNTFGAWISPMTIMGWVLFAVLCVVCFLLARRFFESKFGQ